ncbi:MAG: hypothetical protein J6U92_02215 [Clostridia bacterium]|nr:hypothetical protein [Clostridia bacterium]
MKIIKTLKKLFLSMSALCFILSICFSVGCKTVKFVGFDDITIKVAYGANASLLQYVTAIDQNGKAHRCTVTVKDSKGNPVDVLFDRFNVSSMDGYTAVTTCNGVSRTITILVEDRSTITIEDFADRLFTGYVGKEYQLPDVSIGKASGEIIVPTYKVYRNENSSKVEVPVTDRAFIPSERGVYTLEISATDATGTTATKSEDFKVRLGMTSNMLEDFNDELSASTLIKSTAWGATEQIKYGDGFYTVWHETFDGRKGVIESALNTNLNMRRICATFSFDKALLSEMVAEMTEEDYISIWFWLDKDGQFDAIRQENPQDSSTWTVLSKVTGKKWQEIKIYKNALSIFSDLHSINGSGDQLFFFQDDKQNLNGVKFYIDSISLIKSKFENEIRPTLNQEYTIPELNFVGIQGQNINVETEIQCNLSYTNVALDITDNKTTFTIPGKYDILYKCQLNGVEYEYVKNVTVENNNPCLALSIEDFCVNSSCEIIKENTLGFTYAPYDFYTTWHSSYKGKSGVVETVLNDNSSQYRRLNLKFNKTQSEIESLISKMSDNGYIALNVWIDVDGEVVIRNFGTWGILAQKVVGKTWQTIKITKDMLTNPEFAQGTDYKMPFAKAVASDFDKTVGVFYLSHTNADAVKIYLDDISVIDYNIVNDTEPEKGVEYTLPTCYAIIDANGTVINQLCDVEIKVDGNNTTIPQIINGKVTFSVAGNYVICYKYNNTIIFEKNIMINRLGPTVVEDFNVESSKDRIVKSKNMDSYTTTAFYVNWLAEFEGRTGVVETITNDGSPQRRICGMNAELLSMADEMDDNDYVSIWVYIDSTNRYQFVLNTLWGDNVNPRLPFVQGGEWSEIKLSKAVLTDSKASGEMLMCFYNSFNGNDTEQLKVYIDDIRIVKVD